MIGVRQFARSRVLIDEQLADHRLAGKICERVGVAAVVDFECCLFRATERLAGRAGGLQCELMRAGRKLDAADLDFVREQSPAARVGVLGCFPRDTDGVDGKFSKRVLDLTEFLRGVQRAFFDAATHDRACEKVREDRGVLLSRQFADIGDRLGETGRLVVDRDTDGLHSVGWHDDDWDFHRCERRRDGVLANR